jgi:drug/metabolite transporter (DMT)-like permease
MPTTDIGRPQKNALLGTLAVVAAGALWAIAATVARDLFEAGVEPLELAAARSLIAAASLSFVTSNWARTERTRPWLVVSLGLAIALVNAAYYIAIDHLAVAVAIVLQYTGPAMLVGWMALRTRSAPSPEILLAVAAALAGVVLVSELPRGNLEALDLVGIGAGLASAVLFAGYTLLSEHAGKVYGPLGALRRAFTAASVFWVLLQVFRGWPAELFEASNVGRVIFVGVMGTLAPFSLYLWGVGHIKAERASIVATSEPVLAALFAWLLLGQGLSLMQICGGLLVIAAIVALEASGHAKAISPEP